MIPPMFYTEEECSGAEDVQKLFEGIQGISYAILFASLISCKIVGIELFGVLQLAFFNLADHDFLNIYLAPLAEFKTFNGINIDVYP